MIRSFIRGFVSKVLDTDGTSRPDSQVEFLQDFLSKHKYIFSKDFEQNLVILKKKHLVDSFLVTNLDGSVIVSTEGNGINEGLVGTAMFSYIKSEMPSSEAVMIKREDGWFFLFPFGKKIFLVKAGSELTNIELKALAIDLGSFLEEGKKKEFEVMKGKA